jgi:transcription elongation factor SPT5
VFEDEQMGVYGVVQEIVQDVVTVSALGVDIEGQKLELPARSVRKRFKLGDHVKAMTGQNADETGLVVSVSDHIVTFLSDMSIQEVCYTMPLHRQWTFIMQSTDFSFLEGSS